MQQHQAQELLPAGSDAQLRCRLLFSECYPALLLSASGGALRSGRNENIRRRLIPSSSLRGRPAVVCAFASGQKPKFNAMKISQNAWLLWILVVVGVLMVSCTSNALPWQSPISPVATATEQPTATKQPTATSTPTPQPTSTIVPPTVTPQIISTVPVSSGICKSTNYCPLTDCRKEECLFVSPYEPDYPVGIATVRGYYTKIKKTGFGDEVKLCDSFVIVDGSQELIRSYLSLIEAGNGVNSKNELNQPIISLDLNKVDAQDKQKILSATKDRTIELLLLSPIPSGMGAPTCYSPVQIIKVN